MKVLIVNYSDIKGGAARAAFRLYKALLKDGVDVKMLVNEKLSDEYSIVSPVSKIKKLALKILTSINSWPLKHYNKSTLFSPSFSPSLYIADRINTLNPDIVHLHWINAGMIKIEDLKKIKAPIVWSLHDMWPFTGGCHYSGSCNKYEDLCGKCAILESKKGNDISKKTINRKIRTFKDLNLTIVALSKWIESCAKSSNVFQGKQILNIPNPIDVDVFKPTFRANALQLFNLNKDKKYILFGAMSATSDTRKGFKELKEALSLIQNDDIELLIYGSSKPANTQGFNFKTHYLGQLYDDISLTLLYNVAHVCVVPSLEENLSNVIMESLSCATPVVAFNIGGNNDLIKHKQNGYLARAKDSNDLSKGINWVLKDSNQENLKANARTKVLSDFESKKVAKKYINLYKSIIANKS